MITRDEAGKLAKKILAFSKFPECSISVTEAETAYIRFANNGITTSGESLTRDIVISSTREGRTGTIRISESDDEALRTAVVRSEEIASTAPVNQEHVGPVDPQ